MNRHRLLIATACVVAVVVCARYSYTNSVEGRLERHVDRTLRSGYSLPDWEAAVVAEGTNAVPVLIRWLDDERKQSRENWLIEILNLIRTRSFHDRREVRAYLASHSFHLFTTNAQWAVGQLEDIQKKNHSVRIGEALRGIRQEQ